MSPCSWRWPASTSNPGPIRWPNASAWRVGSPSISCNASAKSCSIVADWLEQNGISHRDIKPDNIGVGRAPSGRLTLILFDFSLANTPADNLRAGTPPYLDPFIRRRQPPRWDLYAERFAIAMTLYEMATGPAPTWGDGLSDPAMLDCEVTLDERPIRSSRAR